MCNTTTDKTEQSYHSVHTEVDLFFTLIILTEIEIFPAYFSVNVQKIEVLRLLYDFQTLTVTLIRR